MSKPEDQQADWISWVLQYLFGFAVGAAVTWFTIESIREDLDKHALPMWTLEFCLGGAFFMAGLAAFYGDRMWLSSVYRQTHPDQHSHSKASKNLAAISFVLGLGIMIAVFLKWLGLVA